MENEAATLYCPNEYCQAANPLTHNFCQRCSTPLPKRYLWAVGDGLSLGSVGQILADRYLVIGKTVVLDIKPGLLPQTSELDGLPIIRAYLKLIPYRLHIPQIYGVLSLGDKQSRRDILLLEKVPLLMDAKIFHLNVCSSLASVWHEATSIRQIHYLWQIANLWQPLLVEGVASSLLDPNLLRVEGPLVRLLELRSDGDSLPTLSQLGTVWEESLVKPQPAVSEFIQQISNSLIQNEIISAEQLIKILDQGLSELWQAARSELHPTQSVIKIITQTDTGPTRQRNEDACYPPNNVIISKPPQQNALAIVCDGIGGHEGGNVASNLAIETIHQQAKDLTSIPPQNIEPSILLNDLEAAIANVNDRISQRNDSEHRQGRQRMGTTLVMALPIAHEIYIAHVGDSRAYWITRYGCYQVTLDDDIASREVRLGYAVYRDALQQSGSGSLVQALGMSKSTSLHPTAQRFIVDEDAVFLLTSDGLSDFDRVEDYWETEILPILTEDANIESVSQRLIEIANTKNGHDNVTIALIHYQVKYSEPDLTLTANLTQLNHHKTVNLNPKPTETYLKVSEQKTAVIPETLSERKVKLPLSFLAPLMIALVAGSLGYGLMQWRNSKPEPSPVHSSQPTNQNQTAPQTPSPAKGITESQSTESKNR